MYFGVLFGFGDSIYTCVYKKKAVPLRRFYNYKYRHEKIFYSSSIMLNHDCGAGSRAGSDSEFRQSV